MMKPERLFLIFCILLPSLLLPVASMSSGSTERPDQQAGEAADTGTITGRITIKGSEPKTFVALTTEAGTVYEITGPLTGRLQEEYQYRTVTLEGALVRTSAGPGMPAQFRAEKIVSGN